MRSIAEVATDLVGAPRPVICLDTCILLDIIRTVTREQTNLIEVNRGLSGILASTRGRVQLVVTSLVLREWVQHRNGAREEAARWLKDTDGRILDVHSAWQRLGRPLAISAPTYYTLDLVDELTNLAESLLRASLVLKEDAKYVMRALQRVKRKKRPSHKREIKDSIHLENYLELSRWLLDAGYGQPVIFVSTNSSDFWKDKTTPNRPHDDLVHDLAAANLVFFGSLPLALKHLGLLGDAAPSAAVGQ